MTKVSLITGDSSLTGAPLHVLQLAKNLKSRGFDILIIAPPGKLIDRCKQSGCKFKQIFMRGPLDRQAVKEIYQALKEYSPDIVHTHGIRGGWLGRLAARNIKAKKIYTEHLWTPTFHLKNRAYEQFQLRGLKFMDRYTDATIAVSKTVYDFLLKRGFDKRKIYIIPNGINPRFLKEEPIKKPPSVPFLVGTIGSLNIVKNHQTAIRAIAIIAKKYPKVNVHLQIVGEGPMKNSLIKLAQKLGVSDRVHLLGRVDDVIERLKHFSIYVGLSLSESFGLSVGEAMAVGLPVIASDIPALKELVGSAGIIVPRKDANQVARQIVKLTSNSSLRNNLGKQAKKRIAEKFSQKAMIDKTVWLYKKLVS